MSFWHTLAFETNCDARRQEGKKKKECEWEICQWQILSAHLFFFVSPQFFCPFSGHTRAVNKRKYINSRRGSNKTFFFSFEGSCVVIYRCSHDAIDFVGIHSWRKQRACLCHNNTNAYVMRLIESLRKLKSTSHTLRQRKTYGIGHTIAVQKCNQMAKLWCLSSNFLQKNACRRSIDLSTLQRQTRQLHLRVQKWKKTNI